MKMKKAIILATLALAAFIAFAYGANWYYSATRSTTVVDYEVTLEEIPATTSRYSLVSLNGDATLGGVPLPGVTIYIQLNNVQVGSTTTNGAGDWSYQYNATELAGTVLNFKAGINQ